MTLPIKNVDTLIFPGWVIPITAGSPALEHHALAITGERISAIVPVAEARAIEALETIELPEHALLPGLINCHGHAAMTLLRGYADDLPLMPWLEQHIWPAEGAHMSEEFVRDGVELALAEMIRSGTTCFSDMYFFPNVVADACIQAGVRCQLTFPIFDFASVWGENSDDYISKGLALRDDYKHSELLRVVFGPHAPYTVSEPALEKIATLAAELDLPIHIHLHETLQEVDEAVAAKGSRPLARLNELGLIGPRTQCVHMTELSKEDIELLAATGASVIHCPDSNMKLAAGICPVTDLQAAGIAVALGTDSAASNNDLNLLGEARSAGLLAKLSSGDAGALPASRLLQMATIDGARVMGRESDIGSLEVGKLADLIAVDLGQPESQPVYDPVSQLIYASNPAQVTESWIGGNPVMRNRQLLTLNLEQIGLKAKRWQTRIANTEGSGE